MSDLYDIIIIGGGPAGLTAGLYASRGGSKTLLLEKTAVGGLVAITENVENYPGFPDGINGFDLTNLMEKQARKFGLEITTGEVIQITPEKSKSDSFIIKTSSAEYKTLSIIVASGTIARKLGIPGEEKFTGKGVSYCATCDAPFFKDKEIVVVGGGDAAVEEALFLTKFVKKISLVHRRDRLRATKVIRDQALKHPKFNFIWNSRVTGITGENKTEKVTVENINDQTSREITVNGVFIFIGFIPNTSFLKDVIDLDETGYVLANAEAQTSRTGIFACGDVIKKRLRQIVNACGEGSVAASNARHYVDGLKGMAYK
ncbi:MAG: thioredoxin-disulfide reductase [Planctomycetes bacterium]|nr:thioredoxin-disulfide reductase [Planctomycetota bacterium]